MSEGNFWFLCACFAVLGAVILGISLSDQQRERSNCERYCNGATIARLKSAGPWDCVCERLPSKPCVPVSTQPRVDSE